MQEGIYIMNDKCVVLNAKKMNLLACGDQKNQGYAF